MLITFYTLYRKSLSFNSNLITFPMLNIFKSETRDNLWKAIIRPPKFQYKPEDLGLYFF